MKKLFLAGAVALFGLVNAQESGNIRIGANANLPLGEWGKVQTFGLGLDVAYVYPLAQNFKVGVASGYTHYFGKKQDITILGVTTSVKATDIGHIPVGATMQYQFGDSPVFIGADLGYAFLVNKPKGVTTTGTLYYQPKLGFSFGKSEVAVSYKGFYDVENESKTADKHSGALSLGYAYNF